MESLKDKKNKVETPPNYLKFVSSLQTSEFPFKSANTSRPYSPFIHDETPVKKSQKTFEQLLEEELEKNNGLASARTKSSKKSPKFLKRGEGTLCTNRATTPINPGLSTLPQGFTTPSKAIAKFRKSTSQINIKRLQNTGGDQLPLQEKFVIKPLDLYRIRREKWKVREVNNEEEKKNITERMSKEEVNGLKKIIKFMKENEKNKEKELRNEIEKYKNETEDLRKQNIKLLLENNSLRQRLAKRPANSAVSLPESNKTLKTQEKVPENSEKIETIYPSGAKRETYPNGYIITYYINKDIKQEYPDGKSIYFFASTQTTQTTYKSGKKELKFQNGQEEIFFPDGLREIRFVNGTIKYIFPNGDEKVVFQDGTIQKIVR